MKTLDRELERAAFEIKEASQTLAERHWDPHHGRRMPAVMMPVIALLLLLVAIAVPTMVFTRDDVISSVVTAPPETEANVEHWADIFHSDDDTGGIPAFRGFIFRGATIGMSDPNWDHPVYLGYHITMNPVNPGRPDVTLQVGPDPGATPRDWPSGEEIPSYDSGEVIIRDDRKATLIHDRVTHRIIAVRWVETSGAHVLLTSLALDVMELAEALEWIPTDDTN